MEFRVHPDQPLGDALLQLDDGGELWLGNFCHFTEQWTNHPHRHPQHHEFCLVLGGRGEFMHGDVVHAVGPGSLFVSDLDVVHEIRSPRSRDLVLMFFSWAPGQAPAASPFRTAHHIHRPDQLHLASLLPGLQVSAGDAERDRRRRLDLLRCLWSAACNALACDIDQQQAREAMPVHRAQRFMAARCAEAISVADIAAAAGLGERQLRRLFQQQLGCTVVQALVRERLRQATRHLVMQFPVAECARRVGIASPSMFCRLFKAQYGQTPRAWQAEHAPRSPLELTEFGG